MYNTVTPGQSVFHYTDQTSCLAILETGTLFATDCRYLNDRAEILYGYEMLIRLASDEWTETNGLNPKQQQVLSFLLSLLSIDELLKDVCLLCTSTEGDLVPQWQGYGGSSAYAIRLDTEAYLAPVAYRPPPDNPPRFRMDLRVTPGWRPVLYERTQQVDAVRHAIDVASEHYDAAGPSRGVLSSGYPWQLYAQVALINFLCTAKDPAFQAEQEIRYLAPRESGHMKFRSGRTGFVPHLRLSQYQPDSDQSHHLPITGLVIGP